jgi:S1-C subfamily serine protease
MIKVMIFLSLITVSFSSWSLDPRLLEVEKKTIGIYRKTLPSIVNVTNLKVARNHLYGSVEIPQGAGSGFVWDQEGHIVTNHHVVDGGSNFLVTFHDDSKQYKAVLVGSEPKKDIAVLKLQEKPSRLQPVFPGISKDLEVGQMSLAIGSPFGLDSTLTTGVISALGRKIDGFGGVKIHDMIQTDAAINMGNSGGPLLNSSGELIGMNTMIFSPSGSSAGLGFAVPVDTIKLIVPELIKHGKIIRPGLGLGIAPDYFKKRIGYKGDGIIVYYVDEDGSAAKAGIKGMSQDRLGRIFLGDIIISINNDVVNSLDDIYHTLEKYKVGETVTIKYLREKETKEAKVVLKSL